jgi:hypothetical protein
LPGQCDFLIHPGFLQAVKDIFIARERLGNRKQGGNCLGIPASIERFDTILIRSAVRQHRCHYCGPARRGIPESASFPECDNRRLVIASSQRLLRARIRLRCVSLFPAQPAGNRSSGHNGDNEREHEKKPS